MAHRAARRAGWSPRRAARVAGLVVGIVFVIGAGVLAQAVWQVRDRQPVSSFTMAPSPTYVLRTPTPPATPTPSPSVSPRLTELEMTAAEEWDRQETDHQTRETAAEATRTVTPDRCCTRPPAPVTSPKPVPKPPAQTPTGKEHVQVAPVPAPETIATATPTPQPSDPTYTGPAFLGAYCSKLDATAIATGPEESVGTPVQCTRLEGEGVVDGYPAARWLPLPPTEATGGAK